MQRFFDLSIEFFGRLDRCNASFNPGICIGMPLALTPGLSRGRFQTDGRSDDGRGGVRDLDAL
jgi:hypothetical protein